MSRADERRITAGIDIGTSSVKVAVMATEPSGSTLLDAQTERIYRRDPLRVAESALEQALGRAEVPRAAVCYVASTGEGDAIPWKDGHFYGMTTHARGATWLLPGARAVVDLGALHTRVLAVDERSRVLRHRMTSQCASGTGQFLESIARYLGVRLDDIGPLSLEAQRSEQCSSICAVLAETDVINMVSRGVPTGELLRGIHDSISGRVAKLLRSISAASPVLLTGGLARDVGLRASIERRLVEDGGTPLAIHTHPRSTEAGAIGAALWAAHRHARLTGENPLPAAAASA